MLLQKRPQRVPMIVSHAVFCTRIASSRSTGTSNSSSAAHFMATAALRCIDHKKTKTNATWNSSYKNKNKVREGRGGAGVPWRSAPPPPAASCAAPTDCSPTSTAARPPRRPPQRAPARTASRATSVVYRGSREKSYAGHSIVGFIQQPSQPVLALSDLRLACKAMNHISGKYEDSFIALHWQNWEQTCLF